MEESTRSVPTDYDGAWKAALEIYLEPFLRLCFPIVHAAVEWSRPFEFLDKELQEIVRDAETGPLRVDKLIKVFRRDGVEEWLLIHIEIQSQPDHRLAMRVYQYRYRIADRYQKPVVSLVVLADDSPGFRPGPYEEDILGCRVRFEYPSCKLLDLEEAMLEAEDNPIAMVILAHRAAQVGAGDAAARKAQKWRLTRRLYERWPEREDILELFRLIDWLIWLPREEAIEFRREVAEYEEQKRMPYITSIEEMGRQKGREQGLEQGRLEGRQEGMIAAQQNAVLDVVEVRFGKIPDSLREAVGMIRDEARLRVLHKSAIQAGSLEEFTAGVASPKISG
jgi:hypothetical protein